MQRRTFLGAGGAAAGALLTRAADAKPEFRTTAGRLPRKVIAGTVMQDLWGDYPGLQPRLDQLGGLVDGVARLSREKYNRGPDIVVLPETAVTGECGASAGEVAVSLDGPLRDVMGRKAREHRTYLVVPTYLRESDGKNCSNAAILFGRDGGVVGTYRKVHLVVSHEDRRMEGGSIPGAAVPVFDCDFGKLGIQICYDMEFDSGWDALARQGCELVVWPSQSPQTATPAFRAMRRRFYIVSSTWRNNASVFEPTGRIAAQIRPPEKLLSYEMDLSYAILPWSGNLQNGEALQKKYGDAVGFHYYEDEDRGIFWSNDPRMSIREMMRPLGLEEQQEQFANDREVYRRAGLKEF